MRFWCISDTKGITDFRANSQFHNLTVNETDVVTLQCTAVGRPTPAMRIMVNNRETAQQPQGEVTEEVMVTLTNMTSHARCEDGGQYMCTLTDQGNSRNTQSVQLYVNCKCTFLSQCVCVCLDELCHTQS